MPANRTVDIERASDDLKNLRESELAADLESKGADLQRMVDEIRAGDIGPNSAEAIQAAKAAAEASLQQYQDGVDRLDPEVQKLLQHPKLVQAVQQELAAAEHAKQQHIAAAEQARAEYHQSTLNAAKIAAANVVANFPEIAGVEPSAIPLAIQLLREAESTKSRGARWPSSPSGKYL